MIENAIDNISVDCIIYSYSKEKLNVLLVKHAVGPSKGAWGLPGGWVNYNEDIDNAAERVLTLHTGLKNVYLKQLKTFGEVDRYPKKRVITISYFSLIKYSEATLRHGESVFDAKWFVLEDCPDLIFDHLRILEYANSSLRQIVRYKPIGFRLLPKEFTLLQLQHLYEAILKTEFDKSNFRRKIFKMNLLVDTGKKQKNVSHRAANLYRFDKAIYEKLKEKGFTFDL